LNFRPPFLFEAGEKVFAGKDVARRGTDEIYIKIVLLFNIILIIGQNRSINFSFWPTFFSIKSLQFNRPDVCSDNLLDDGSGFFFFQNKFPGAVGHSFLFNQPVRRIIFFEGKYGFSLFFAAP